MWGSSAGRDAGRERPGAGAGRARAAGGSLGLRSPRELLLVSLELSAEPGPAPSWAPCSGSPSRGAAPPKARGVTRAALSLPAAVLPAFPAVAACSHGKAARSALWKSALGTAAASRRLPRPFSLVDRGGVGAAGTDAQGSRRRSSAPSARTEGGREGAWVGGCRRGEPVWSPSLRRRSPRSPPRTSLRAKVRGEWGGGRGSGTRDCGWEGGGAPGFVFNPGISFPAPAPASAAPLQTSLPLGPGGRWRSLGGGAGL